MHSYDRVVKTRANPPHHNPLQRVCAARALSEALAQSRALARKSSLTDLRIACEPAASRDSGTDASQANEAVASAFTAGSVAEQQQRQHGACSPAGAEDDLSPGAVTRWVKKEKEEEEKGLRYRFKVAACLGLSVRVRVGGLVLGLGRYCVVVVVIGGAMRDGAPQGRRFEWAKEAEQRTQLLRRGVAEPLTWSSEECVEQIITGCSSLCGKVVCFCFTGLPELSRISI